MQIKYCWRCATDVPMLNEREYAPIMKRYGECLQDAKAQRRKTGKAVSDPAVQACFRPVTELYSRVTGRAGIDPQEIMDIGSSCWARPALNAASHYVPGRRAFAQRAVRGPISVEPNGKSIYIFYA